MSCSGSFLCEQCRSWILFIIFFNSWLWNSSALRSISNRIMRHIQPFSSDFLPSALLGFTLLSTSKPPLDQSLMCYPFLKGAALESQFIDGQSPLAVSLVCFDLPVPCCPHLSDPTTAAQNLSGTSAPFISYCCFMFPSCSTGNWTQSKLIVILTPLINIFIFTLRKSLAKSTKYLQVITPNTAPKMNIGIWKYSVLTVGLKTSVMCLWYPMAVKETWGRV